MNTIFEYLYRDSCNYKTFKTAALSGAMTNQDWDAIRACLSDGEYFLPSQVGLDNSRDWAYNENEDHPWFEPTGFTIVPAGNGARTPAMSVTELVARFQSAKDNWDIDQYPYG